MATKTKPSRTTNPDVRRTVAEVAKFFGMSTAAVMAWKAEAEPMPGSTGNYNLSEIAQWRITKSGTGKGLSDDQKKADIRLKTVQAQQKELDLEMQKGNLVLLDEVKLGHNTALIEFREFVLSLPDVLATSSPPESRAFMREESDRHLRASLSGLERRLRALEDELQAKPEAEAE
jgi:hypothetical protein